ncbi:MAG: beta-lactamase family protein [Candidatus Eremiobacteraeota bacterium]|nr:beta-lactamase family protein [Candidatus Eremiobacteraeota bacterium]
MYFVLIALTMSPLSAEQVRHRDASAIFARLSTQTASTLGAAGDPGAAIVVADRDGVVACRGFGVDFSGRPVTCDSPFAIASLTKSVTALAVRRLAAERRLALDEPVARYLPWFRPQDGDRITVRDLLEQGSGLSESARRAWLGSRDDDADVLRRHVEALNRELLLWPPGSRFEYSNANYDVLGILVAAASGVGYEEYVRTRVLAPLRILRVSFSCKSGARGYSRWFSVPVRGPAPPNFCADAPAGGLILSARQYGRYLAAHLDEGRTWSRVVLSAAGWRDVHRSAPSFPYAMGWFDIVRPDGARELRHTGSAPEFQTFAMLLPSRGIGAARFANAGESPDFGRRQPIERNFEAILLGFPEQRIPWFPADLPVRLAALFGLVSAVATLAQFLLVRNATLRTATIAILLRVAILAALAIFLLPQWGWSPATQFAFAPDLSALLTTSAGVLGVDVICLVLWLRKNFSNNPFL